MHGEDKKERGRKSPSVDVTLKVKKRKITSETEEKASNFDASEEADISSAASTSL